MAGNTGSPLCAELNRIANYGVYPDRDDFLEEQGAANSWAGTSGLGLLGALNYIVDPNRTDNNYKGLTAVCNELAGTTGLSDVDALRTIGHPAEVLLKGTTARSASYYVDATTPTNWGSLGYIYFNGVAGNTFSVPDSNALDITGDIDLRVQVAPDTWGPASTINVFQATAGDPNRKWRFNIGQGGGDKKLNFIWWPTGSLASGLTSVATVDVPMADGALKWIRVTLDVDNGAAGNDTKFWTSDDGVTWTQLGATVTKAGTTSLSSNAAGIDMATTSGIKYYRAQVLNGIGGTTVLDVNIATDYKSSNLDTFTATTGQTVTVNGVGTVANYGTAGSLLPTTVGSSTAADSNDPKFLDHTGTNYVYVTGVSGNNLSVPNAAPLQITGDIDVRVQVALDDWTPSAGSEILSKSGSAGNRGWLFNVSSTGQLQVTYSVDGTATLTRISTVAPTIADGAPLWIRFTLDVDNGASGNDFKFFTSTDGTTWTQLGTTVTNAGTTSIFASTAEVRDNGASNFKTGKVFRAQIYSDITETNKVLDVDTSVITTGAATSFTAVTGQTVTINRSTSGRKTVAVTQPTWLFGTDDYMEVNNRYMAHSTAAENYVYLNGVTGNNMLVSDNPPLDITSDIDIQVKVALDDWTPSSNSALLTKWVSANSYYFYVSTAGALRFAWTTTGTSPIIDQPSTVTTGFADGTLKWVRVTLDVDNGAGGYDLKFFTSDDGTTWTQLGSTVTGASTTSIFSGAAAVRIGAAPTGDASKGKFYRAIIKNGIDGTVVLDADASVITLPSQTTFVDRSSNAYTVTINKSGVGTFVSTGNYLYLPGVFGNNASAPDSAALDITGDIDLRFKLAMDDWTPSAINDLFGKTGVTADAYRLRLLTTGVLRFMWTNNSAVTITADSTVATGVTDGATKWVRVTLDVDNGASGNDVKFFTSDDGITWTQLGSTVTTAGVTDIRATAANLFIGSYYDGNVPSRGKFFRAQVLNGINGTLAFDANFESSITSLLQTSFTESSTNGATVTINRSGSTYRSAGVIDAGYLYPGATNTFSNSTTDFLNMGANQDFTVVTISRQFGTTNPAFAEIIAKHNSADFSPGYAIVLNASGVTASFATPDGTNKGTAFAQGYTSGNLATYTGYRSGSTVALSLNAANPTTATGSTNTLSNIHPLRIGRNSVGLLYHDMEFIGAAVFRNTLTTKNIADIINYFNGRD